MDTNWILIVALICISLISKGDQSWVFIGRTDAEVETPILWPPYVKIWLIGKDPDAERDWGGGGEGDDRGWDGWMASLTQWTWVWVISGSWWWTGRPGVLRFMGSQRVRHDWATELKWTKLNALFLVLLIASGYTVWKFIKLCIYNLYAFLYIILL